jgi:hypothetical protein
MDKFQRCRWNEITKKKKKKTPIQISHFGRGPKGQSLSISENIRRNLVK